MQPHSSRFLPVNNYDRILKQQQAPVHDSQQQQNEVIHLQLGDADFLPQLQQQNMVTNLLQLQRPSGGHLEQRQNPANNLQQKENLLSRLQFRNTTSTYQQQQKNATSNVQQHQNLASNVLLDKTDPILQQGRLVQQKNSVSHLQMGNTDSIRQNTASGFHHQQTLVSNVQLRNTDCFPEHQENSARGSLQQQQFNMQNNLHQNTVFSPVQNLKGDHQQQNLLSRLQQQYPRTMQQQHENQVSHQQQQKQNVLGSLQPQTENNWMEVQQQHQASYLQQQNSLQLLPHQLIQLQAILTPQQLQQVLSQQQAQSAQTIDQEVVQQQRQNGRVCKKKSCCYCNSTPCGTCGNCLNPSRKNKCLRR